MVEQTLGVPYSTISSDVITYQQLRMYEFQQNVFLKFIENISLKVNFHTLCFCFKNTARHKADLRKILVPKRCSNAQRGKQCQFCTFLLLLSHLHLHNFFQLLYCVFWLESHCSSTQENKHCFVILIYSLILFMPLFISVPGTTVGPGGTVLSEPWLLISCNLMEETRINQMETKMRA